MRVGEHDLKSSDDGEDVPIVSIEVHNAYNTTGGLKNDIAMLYLEYDVEINGKYILCKTLDFRCIKKYNIFLTSILIDRVRPICLPVDKKIQIDGKNPFVGKYFHYYYLILCVRIRNVSQ